MSRGRIARSLDAAVPAVVAATILTAAAGSSIQLRLYYFGIKARWVLLALLLAFAAARFLADSRGARFPRGTGFLLGAFCGLSLVSTAWSVDRHGTLGRALAQPVAVVALVLLAACAVARPALGSRMLDGVLAAAAVVAVAGFVYWLVDPARAAQAASVQYPSRYRGIEESPNTAAVLLAIATPIAVWRALLARSLAPRAGLAALAAIFVASISASGSRGGLLACFVGVIVVVGLAPLAVGRRVALAALAVAALAVAAWAMTIPKALPASAAAPAQARTSNADTMLPLDGEIGNPWWTHRDRVIHRTLFGTSVRMRALRGAVDQALERPLLGFGFGAEAKAFVNRYYGFSSGNPENGYAGILLQVGIAGLVLWLAALAACVVPGLRAMRRAARPSWALGATGAAVAGLAVGLSQSYFHGPGGIGYVALWTSLVLAAVATTAVAE